MSIRTTARSFTVAGQFSSTRSEAALGEPEALLRASAEARLALEAAIAASTEALQRARSVSAQLDARLTQTASRATPVAGSTTTLVGLSPREREVLALVAAGHTNRAIAESLFLSPNTVKTHVSSLLTKLRAETRVQLAVIAVRPETSAPTRLGW